MTQPRTILLVEDNEGDVEVTKIAFEESGLLCRVDVAHDGLEAMEYLIRPDGATPAFILLDINMPRMDGLEFLKIVKQDERFKAIPVIMLTSSDTPVDIRTCYMLHANCYIIKPSEMTILIETVRQLGAFWLELARLPAAA